MPKCGYCQQQFANPIAAVKHEKACPMRSVGKATAPVAIAWASSGFGPPGVNLHVSSLETKPPLEARCGVS